MNNKRDVDYSSIGFIDAEAEGNNVIYFLHKHAQLFPDKIALEWARRDGIGTTRMPHDFIRYEDFVRKISRTAGGLKKLGVRKGDRVIVFVPMSLELYLSMFAVLRIGAIAVFLDSWARKDHLGTCANAVQPKAMVSLEAAFDLCGSVSQLDGIGLKIVVGEHKGSYSADLEELLNTAEQSEIEPVKPKDTALITFTTGSSGIPKGANRTHTFLAAQHRALDRTIPYAEDDIDMPVFPIFSLNNLAGGVSTVIPAIDLAYPSAEDAQILVNQIFSARVNCCTLSPSLFSGVAAFCIRQHINLPCLKRVVTGGAPVSKDSVRGFQSVAPNAEILVLYGSTEVEPIAHIEAKEMLADISEKEGVNVGRISDALEYKFIRIFRENIELKESGWKEWEVEKGKIGELVVSGPHVCEDYYNNPEAVRATKIVENNGKIWHRTGDLAYLDDKENLWIVGRIHNVIVRANEYVFPVRAEILLKKLSFVREAAYLGVEDVNLGEKACVVVSLKEESSREDPKKYIDEIINILQKNKVAADQVIIVSDIPMDPRHHSKVEYSKLKLMLRQQKYV